MTKFPCTAVFFQQEQLVEHQERVHGINSRDSQATTEPTGYEFGEGLSVSVNISNSLGLEQIQKQFRQPEDSSIPTNALTSSGPQISQTSEPTDDLTTYQATGTVIEQRREVSSPLPEGWLGGFEYFDAIHGSKLW
jgi:hypothetical protein